MFSRNIKNLFQLKILINDIKKILRDKKYPILIKDAAPWYIRDIETDEYKPDYNYGKNLIASYEKQLFNSICIRIFNTGYIGISYREHPYTE